VIRYLENQVFRTILAPSNVAGILVEPIQGEGGYVVPSPGFFRRLRRLCDEHGILLIVDEIQSGVGRTGRWWAVEHEDIVPDVICFAKGIASGLPLGGIIARKELMDWPPGAHASTFGGNPVATAAALATLDVIEEEGLLVKAAETGAYILDALSEIQARHPGIGDVRSRGLMIGIEFVEDRQTKKRAVALRDDVVHGAFKHGLLLLPCGSNALRFIPALNISRSLVDEGLHRFEQALTEAEERHLP
jgi:4-aminobutyrate aminotransferase